MLERKLNLNGVGDPVYALNNGGMAVGISSEELARDVVKEGGIGVVSSIAQNIIQKARHNQEFSLEEGVCNTVREAKKGGGVIGVNIMCALRYFEDSVRGTMKGGANAIFIGAGMAPSLPKLIEEFADETEYGDPKNMNLFPIVGSAAILKKIHRDWKKHGWEMAGAVLEGRLAGGHLAYKGDRLSNEKYSLESILPEVAKAGTEIGLPVLQLAGGFFDHEDYLKATNQLKKDFPNLNFGLQVGTRYVATHQSGASDSMKKAYLEAESDDVLILDSGNLNSPCKWPFAALKSSPLFKLLNEHGQSLEWLEICGALLGACKYTENLPLTHSACPYGYVLPDSKTGKCPTYGMITENPTYKNAEKLKEIAVYTAGKIVRRVKKIEDARDITRQLIGL